MANDDTATNRAPIEDPRRVRWDVPAWIVRVGTISWNFLGFGLAASMIVIAVAATRDFTIPLIIGLLLGTAAIPLVDWMEERGLPRGFSAFATIILVYGAIVGTFVMIGVALAGQSDELITGLQQAAQRFRSWSDEIPWLETAIADAEEIADPAAALVRDGVATRVASLLDSTFGVLAGVVLSAFLLYYILRDGHQLAADIARSDDPDTEAQLTHLIERTNGHFRGYFIGRAVIAVVEGVSIGVGMALLGVPLALAIGIVNFVGGFVPYIGAMVGGAFAVLLAVSGGGSDLGLAALVVVLVVQNVIEEVVEPRIMGDTLDMRELTVLAVTTLGGVLFGILGLILAAPTYAVAKDVLGELRSMGFFDRADGEAGDAG